MNLTKKKMVSYGILSVFHILLASHERTELGV